MESAPTATGLLLKRKGRRSIALDGILFLSVKSSRESSIVCIQSAGRSGIYSLTKHMRKIFKPKDESWHPYFAWHPVYLKNESSFLKALVWLTLVERRWVGWWTDGFTTFGGFYQYRGLFDDC